MRKIAKRLQRPIAILQDLQGPKIRVGLFKNGFAILKDGSFFNLLAEEVLGDRKQASISYKKLAQEVQIGEEILLDDGLLRLEVVAIKNDVVQTRVLVGGKLKNRKGVNLPHTMITQPSLTAKDQVDLEFGLTLGVDFVALSFVRTAQDIHELKSRIPISPFSPKIIAKIEKPTTKYEHRCIYAF